MPKRRRKALLLTGARLLDPLRGRDGVGDILIQGEEIVSVGKLINPPRGVTTVDCKGLLITPAFCDGHVHFRTPGQEHKETIETGCNSAARGGITTVITMPNTTPPIDSPRAVASILRRYKKEGSIEIHIAAAITNRLDGHTSADWVGIINAGAIGITDDGRWTRDDGVMMSAIQFGRMYKVPVMTHAEHPTLSKGGVVHQGKASRKLKVKGIPSSAETEAVERDISFARKTGGPIHIQHVSTAEAIELIRRAKSERVSVTCEATPHHLLLTERDVIELKSNGKMNPPIRTEKDRQAIIEGLLDGTVDYIATDHAPHSASEKRRPLDKCPFGVIGMETMFSSIYTGLVLTGILPLPKFIELITHAPRKYFKLPLVSLRHGSRADITVIDPDRKWKVKKSQIESKSKNSCFIGREFTGQVLCTIHRGRIVYGIERFGEL